jgi:hypothetical protein
MPTVRQVLTGLPPQKGPTAFMPLRALSTAVMDVSRAQGTPEEITGQPGTMGIPAPYPPATGVGHEGGYDKLPSGLSESRYMPPRWYPSIYYRPQHLSVGIGGVRVYSDNQMPVPAVDPRRLPIGSQGPVGFAAYPGLTPAAPARPNRRVAGLGKYQVAWPFRMPAWPAANGS